MVTNIQKWGNSLAFRIPRAFAQEVNVRQGSKVNLSLVEGRLIVTPVLKPPRKFRDLLKKINKHNIHHEQDFGQRMGNELW